MGAIDEMFDELTTALGPEAAEAVRDQLTLAAMKAVRGGASKASDISATIDKALGPVAAKAVKEAAARRGAEIATELTKKYGADADDVDKFIGFLRGVMR